MADPRALAERRPIVRLALSRAEVALSIGVSVSSVDQMVDEGALPPPRKWHSRKLWLVSEIEANLNEWPTEGDPHSSWTNVFDEPASTAPSASPYPDALQEHFKAIGYDPATMGDDDYRRLFKLAEEKWKASIPGTPFNKRENSALVQLKESGARVGELIRHDVVKGCGPNTAQRLEARGFIEIRFRAPNVTEGIVLTQVGAEALHRI